MFSNIYFIVTMLFTVAKVVGLSAKLSSARIQLISGCTAIHHRGASSVHLGLQIKITRRSESIKPGIKIGFSSLIALDTALD